MCGRLNVIDAPLAQQVSQLLGISFRVETNRDLSPGQPVETVFASPAGIQQQRCRWGIQPRWAKRLLINAQAETVASKPTFQQAFAERRCLVPCSGWYEWRDEGAPRKRKYLFAHAAGEPLYMAALWYPAPERGALAQLVTLTTAPNERCRAFHPRMPLLVTPAHIPTWLEAPGEQLAPLLRAVDSELIRVSIA